MREAASLLFDDLRLNWLISTEVSLITAQVARRAFASPVRRPRTECDLSGGRVVCLGDLVESASRCHELAAPERGPRQEGEPLALAGVHEVSELRSVRL